MKNIVLIGFMGTGKTSTGKLLAKRLGAAFIDLDRAIEEEYGMTIPVMFQQKGEAYFRACEHAMVEKTAGRRNTVISTGGGTVKDPANMAALHEGGIIVCLKADIDTILARTASHGTRPVLDSEDQGDRRQAIASLLAERCRLYEVADFYVDTSTRTPREVVDEIIRQIKHEKIGGGSHA